MGLVVASNRGPVAFRREADGRLTARRGGGGVAANLAVLLEGTGATWCATALTDDDREAARSGAAAEHAAADGYHLTLVDVDAETYRLAYDTVANEVLWFLHHGLFDLPHAPIFDRSWPAAWAAYRQLNEAFAEAIAATAPRGATVAVQDYHLALLGALLAGRRPDVAAVYFQHTPFCGPSSIRVLPSAAAEELLVGMAGFRAVGFHAARWANAYRASSELVIGAAPPTYIAPLGPDPGDIGAVAASEPCAAALARLDAAVGDRRVIARADRIELSKNIVRGFLAYDELLRSHPEWRARVVFVASVYPSREGVAAYRAYRDEIERVVAEVNERWATPGWVPVLLDATDDFPASVAALRRYDVLLVNPVKDGLNLVAKEGPLVNERDGVLALSRDAGAWDELAGAALEVHPYDIAGTADVLAAALAMAPDERAERAAALRTAAAARTPRLWLDDQLAAATSSAGWR